MDIARSILVVDSIDSMSTEGIEQFIRDGFAYVKLPQPELKDVLKKLHKEAVLFFNQPMAEKEKNGIKFDPETIQGYVDRRKEKDENPILHEQIFFRPNQPLGPFKALNTEIDSVQKTFWLDIGKPLIELVLHRVLSTAQFDSIKINELFREATDDVFSSLSLLYYPFTKQPELFECGLNEHTDQSFITVLWVTQESLQVWLEDDEASSAPSRKAGVWHDLYPKEGYVIVNIGNALKVILGDRCNSALHRVLIPKQERLSIAAFYDPISTYIMRDIVENKLVFGGSAVAYLKDHFSKTYSPTFEKTLENKS